MRIQSLLANIKYFKTIISFPKAETFDIVNGKVINEINGNTFKFQERGVWEKRKISTNNYVQWKTNNKYAELYNYRCSKIEKISTFIIEPIYNNYIEGKEYICSDDIYTPKMKISSSSIIIFWEVKGPKKDYHIVTYYY